MKRIPHYVITMVLSAAAAFAAEAAPKGPIFIYLYARITDHVNLDTTEDRLRRALPMIEKYRKAHPEGHISATILFSGAVSQALADRNAQTHIVDFVREYIRRGIIEPGYDGSDEPTYKNRPLLDFSNAQTSEDRWLVRAATDEKFLSEAREPLTGAPEPGKVGGLKKMQEVFGAAACITGMTMWKNASGGISPDYAPGDPHFEGKTRKAPDLTGSQPEVGGDSELIQVLRRDNSQPSIMFGIADTNPGFLPGFRTAREGYGRIMSPISETSPELYWQDNVLRSSETSGTVSPVRARDGMEAMRAAIGRADRSRVHVIHVELASDQNYLQPAFIDGKEYPPVKYAYNHPESPKAPGDALLPSAAVEAAYAKEDGLLKWLVAEFFPSDLGSRAVSNLELLKMAEPSTGFSVSLEGLRAALVDYLKLAGNDTMLPVIFRAEGHYLSLADMFQVMTDALAEFSRTGKLPESVKVIQVYGPVRLLTGHGPNIGDVPVESIARVCAKIDGGLHDDSPGKFPKNAIPTSVKVDDIQMNPAQFLRLMAQVLAMPAPTPETKFRVRMTYAFTFMLGAYPKSRVLNDAGFGWTLKPAALETKPQAN
jgi:hypothetical protein